MFLKKGVLPFKPVQPDSLLAESRGQLLFLTRSGQLLFLTRRLADNGRDEERQMDPARTEYCTWSI
jgi:hypothetical protein